MEALTKDQQQDLTKYETLDQFFADNQTIVDTYDPFKDEVIDFRNNIGLIPGTASGKTINTTGITTGKRNLKVDASKAYGKIVPVAYAFCIKKGLTDIAANLKWTKAKLLKVDDTIYLDTAKAIDKMITDNLMTRADFATYGITAAMLGTALTKATDFNSSIGKASSVNAEKAAKAVDVENIFDNLHANNEQFNLLINHFKETDNDFYNGYIAANVVHDGVRHTGIDGKVTSEKGGALAGATITNTKSGRVVKTNLLGEYEHEPNRSGLTEFEISAAGHETLKKVIELKRGKIIDINFSLKVA